MTERLEEGYRADLAVADVHDIDDTNHTVAVDFPHEVLDGYRTDWGRGCWDESFAQRLPVMVVNHDPNSLIGSGLRAENLGSKSRLIGRFADFNEVPKARETFSLVRDGHYPGWSFHYIDGRTVPHPNIRSARRFVKAKMLEFSPVPFPSIPGAVAVGLRSDQEAPTLDIPTIDEILRLHREQVITDDGLRALVAEHHPTFKDHIRLVTPSPETQVTDALAPLVDAGLRNVTVSVDAEGKITAGTGSGTRAVDTDDAAQLAAAVDASLDEAVTLVGDPDGWRSLPDNVQQSLALVAAAGVAADELLVVMGVDDIDSGQRAVLSAADRDNLPDDAFAYIEPGGTKDGSGKTIPRDKRHFPIPDAGHVKNALARIAQNAKFGTEAKPKVLAAAKKFGVTIDESGSRSQEDEPIDGPELQADFDRVLDRLKIS